MPEDKETPSRRATDHKFKKRYLLIPIGILVFTVIGFSSLKTFEKRASTVTTETKTTAIVEFDKSAPAIASKESPSPQQPSMATESNKGHFQLSVDILRERENFKAQQQRWYGQLAFSMLVGIASIYVILSKKYPDDCNKWAYSTIAFIMGFWLKSL